MGLFEGGSAFWTVLVIAILAIVAIAKTATVVPQQSAFIVESLGRYSKTLSAGFHILIPFVEKIAYKHSLKEQAIDIPEQVCITRDNVQVGIDGVLYLQVLDAKNASYGITNYQFAISQLAQTTLRSEIGKIDLDRTFEERATINANVVSATRSAISTRRRTCCPRWRSRCAPSARSAR
jgi:regulator of protease activity HflC (stomatin/prohibitin superfamily)